MNWCVILYISLCNCCSEVIVRNLHSSYHLMMQHQLLGPASRSKADRLTIVTDAARHIKEQRRVIELMRYQQEALVRQLHEMSAKLHAAGGGVEAQAKVGL